MMRPWLQIRPCGLLRSALALRSRWTLPPRTCQRRTIATKEDGATIDSDSFSILTSQSNTGTEHSAYDAAESSEVAQLRRGINVYTSNSPFACDLGGELPELTVAYETWGSLNPERSNAVLLHTGLSASSHAASHPLNTNAGWWERFVGPGKALDTRKFFVICCNVLGSCYGSTGPSSIDPRTGRPYATRFPLVTVRDMDHLGIDRLHASVGSSLGGMMSLCAAVEYPDRVSRVVSVSACARSHPYSIALRYAQRRALTSDPNWQGGHYYDTGKFPFTGMKAARIIGHITYRSGPEWQDRFGNMQLPGDVHKQEDFTHTFGPDFLVESYIDYQAHRFSTKYDPNSMLYISKAMDMFDLGQGFAKLQEGLGRIRSPALILGVQSDILFPVHQQKEIATMLKLNGHAPVTYLEVDSPFGHDTFIIDARNIGGPIKGHLEFPAANEFPVM